MSSQRLAASAMLAGREAQTVDAALEAVRQSRFLINDVDRWIFHEVRPYLGRRVLEVGCGHGNFCAHFLACDTELVGAIDIDARSVQSVRERFGADPRFKAKVHDICEPIDDELAGWRADTVFSINVLEHVQDDALAMRRMSGLTGAGGRVLLIVPAHPWAYGKMDRSLGHYRRYTKQSAAALMRQAGLAVDRQFYLNAPGLVGWWLSSALLRSSVPFEAQLRLLNKLVPLIRACERSVRPPVGTSVVTIGSRPGRCAAERL